MEDAAGDWWDLPLSQLADATLNGGLRSRLRTPQTELRTTALTVSPKNDHYISVMTARSPALSTPDQACTPRPTFFGEDTADGGGLGELSAGWIKQEEVWDECGWADPPACARNGPHPAHPKHVAPIDGHASSVPTWDSFHDPTLPKPGQGWREVEWNDRSVTFADDLVEYAGRATPAQAGGSDSGEAEQLHVYNESSAGLLSDEIKSTSSLHSSPDSTSRGTVRPPQQRVKRRKSRTRSSQPRSPPQRPAQCGAWAGTEAPLNPEDYEWSSHHSNALNAWTPQKLKNGVHGGTAVTQLSKEMVKETGGVKETVEARVLALYGESVLQLSRDDFKMWQSKHSVRRLTARENEAFKKVRRRMLGRTYAQASRNKQVAREDRIVRECKRLSAENAQIRRRIAALQQLLDREPDHRH